MAKDAKVLYQIQGYGVIHFAGQPEPAVAITAGQLAYLHNMAQKAAMAVRDNTTDDVEFREIIQELHNTIAEFSRTLTEAAGGHGLKLKDKHRLVGSEEFIQIDDNDIRTL